MAVDLLISGIYERKVDKKNRLAIPADILRVMNIQQKELDCCYISNYGKPNEGCYTIIVPMVMSSCESNLPLYFLRPIDKQHRIILPDSTLNGQMARIIGDGDKFIIQKINKQQNQG